MSEIMKNGIAITTDNNMNEIIFNTKPNPPWSNDVPANMLLFQVSPMPMIDNPASPNDKTPISAAFLFCLYISFLFSNIGRRTVSVIACLLALG